MKSLFNTYYEDDEPPETSIDVALMVLLIVCGVIGDADRVYYECA